MNKAVKISSQMFYLAGVLWVIEAVAEVFGGFNEDFNNIFDYFAEVTFGFSYLALFIGVYFLVKHYVDSTGNKLNWAGKIGQFLMGLSALLLTLKAIINVVYHGFIGNSFLFAEGSVLSPIFLIGVLSSLLGIILFGLSCMLNKALPRWLSFLFLISMLLVFVPVIGKYLTACIYVLVGLVIFRSKKE